MKLDKMLALPIKASVILFAARVLVELVEIRAASVRELVAGGAVDLRDGAFVWSVSPGDVSVFEIVEREER